MAKFAENNDGTGWQKKGGIKESRSEKETLGER